MGYPATLTELFPAMVVALGHFKNWAWSSNWPGFRPMLTNTHTHTITHTYTYTLSLLHTHTYTQTHSLIHSHTNTHTHSLSLSHTHTPSLSHTHTPSLTHTHTHTHMHTSMHTHSHTQTHTHTHTQTHFWWTYPSMESDVSVWKNWPWVCAHGSALSGECWPHSGTAERWAAGDPADA